MRTKVHTQTRTQLPYHRRHESTSPAEGERAGEWYARLAGIKPEELYCETCSYRWVSNEDGRCAHCSRQAHVPFRLETLPARLTVSLPEHDVLRVAWRLLAGALTLAALLGVAYVIGLVIAFAGVRL